MATIIGYTTGGIPLYSIGNGIVSNNPNSVPTTAPTSAPDQNALTIENLLNNPKVKQDLGVNGVTMGKWLQGNASLLPKLSSLGYKIDDLINEAYAQTRTNKSAFSGDMMSLNRSQNTPAVNQQIPDAELRPKLIPNSETELSRNQNANIISENIQPEETKTDLSIYDTFINNDPFLKEQFANQTIKDNFAKMSPTLQMAYIQMMQSLGKQVEAGKVVNPNIEITPEKIKEFTDQATSELDPYYQEQIKNYKEDLDTSIKRLQEDFETGIRNAEEPFKRNLAAQSEIEAQSGLTYGSERKVRENINVKEQQQKIDELSKTSRRSVEDAYKKAERTLGSDVLGNIESPTISEYGVSNKGFQKTGTRNLFSPSGGLIGSLQKEKTTAIKSRVSELEDSYRKQRLLNVNI